MVFDQTCLKVVALRVGDDVAEDVHHLALAHAVHHGLGAAAHGHVCKWVGWLDRDGRREKGREQQGFSTEPKGRFPNAKL